MPWSERLAQAKELALSGQIPEALALYYGERLPDAGSPMEAQGLMELGRHDLALQLAEKVLENADDRTRNATVNRRLAQALTVKGDCLEKLDRTAEAIEAYAQAVSLDAESNGVLGLGRIALRLNDRQLAQRTLAALGPESSWAGQAIFMRVAGIDVEQLKRLAGL